MTRSWKGIGRKWKITIIIPLLEVHHKVAGDTSAKVIGSRLKTADVQKLTNKENKKNNEREY